MDGVEKDLLDIVRRRHVVSDTGDGLELRRVLERLQSAVSKRSRKSSLGTHLPDTEEADKEVAGEARREHLGEDEDVRGKRRLQHDGHV